MRTHIETVLYQKQVEGRGRWVLSLQRWIGSENFQNDACLQIEIDNSWDGETWYRIEHVLMADGERYLIIPDVRFEQRVGDIIMNEDLEEFAAREALASRNVISEEEFGRLYGPAAKQVFELLERRWTALHELTGFAVCN